MKSMSQAAKLKSMYIFSSRRVLTTLLSQQLPTSDIFQLMIPARRTCPQSWTREYEGYLMTSYVINNRMTFECVDQDPEVINGM